MVPCKSCGGDISAQARACPKCGQPQRRDQVFVWFIVVVVLIPAALSLAPKAASEHPLAVGHEMLPQLDELRQQARAAQLQILLSPQALGRSEALQLSTQIISDLEIIESRIESGSATERDIANCGERLKQYSEQARELVRAVEE